MSHLILYHGTSARFLQDVLKKGLRPGNGFVYLSDDPEMAELFARQVGGEPVVLAVRVKDISRLGPDLNMYDTPTERLTRKYGVGIDEPLWGVVSGPKDEDDWRTSLREVNSVIYDGSISPDDVEFGWAVAT